MSAECGGVVCEPQTTEQSNGKLKRRGRATGFAKCAKVINPFTILFLIAFNPICTWPEGY
jgi:hypothetical protein